MKKNDEVRVMYIPIKGTIETCHRDGSYTIKTKTPIRRDDKHYRYLRVRPVQAFVIEEWLTKGRRKYNPDVARKIEIETFKRLHRKKLEKKVSKWLRDMTPEERQNAFSMLTESPKEEKE